jgi:hypothetical protein
LFDDASDVTVTFPTNAVLPLTVKDGAVIVVALKVAALIVPV